MKTISQAGALTRAAGRPLLLLVAMVVAVVIFAGCQDDQPAVAQQGTGEEGSVELLDTVTASGRGTVLASPDEAVLFVTVETQSEEAATAVDENARRMDAVIERLSQEGVGEDQIQTSSVTVFPEGRVEPESGAVQPDTYRATNTVQVILDDLERVGETYSAAVEAGANNVRGPEWRLSDDSVAVQEALKKAATAARGKAQALAESEGASVGDVLVMREGESSSPPFFARSLDEAAAADVAPVPVSPQDLEVMASVTVTYRLER